MMDIEFWIFQKHKDQNISNITNIFVQLKHFAYYALKFKIRQKKNSFLMEATLKRFY